VRRTSLHNCGAVLRHSPFMISPAAPSRKVRKTIRRGRVGRGLARSAAMAVRRACWDSPAALKKRENEWRNGPGALYYMGHGPAKVPDGETGGARLTGPRSNSGVFKIMFRLICTVSTLAAVVTASQVFAQCEPRWASGDGLPGLGSAVYAVAAWDPDGTGPASALLIAGGEFSYAGKAVARNIAATA